MTTKINKALEMGLLDDAKDLLKEYFNSKDKAQWLKTKQEEYNNLYPSTREMTEEEKANYYNKEERLESFEIFEFPLVRVENNVRFDDWLLESKVISEAVEEVSHIEIIDGVETKVIDVAYAPEQTELLREYTPLTETEISLLINEYLISNETYKSMEKEEALKMLDITTLQNGLRFYTDDKSMIDLMAADRKAERLGASELAVVDWKTADGIKEVTIKDIRDAVDLRLDKKGQIVGVEA